MSKIAKKVLGGIVLGALSVFTFGFAAPVFGGLASSISTITGLGAVAAGAVAGGLIAGSVAFLKPKIPNLSSEFGRELQLNGDPTAPRKPFYGEAWTAGTLRFRAPVGDSNEDLYLLIVLAGTPIDSVQEAEADTSTLTLDGSGNVTAPSQYVGLMQIRYHLGDVDQDADATLVSLFPEWTSDHRLRGLPYAIVKLTFDEENMNTVPQLRFKIRGRKVYDPRLDSTNGGTGTHRLDDDTTWEWSDNAVLCACDFLRGVKLVYGSPLSVSRLIAGVGVSDTRVSWPNVIAEANICDEAVNLAAGGTQPRYTVNGFIDPRQEHGQNLRHFEVAMAGDITFADGKWRFFAGAYRTPTLHLEDKHFIGPLRHLVHKGAAERVDTVQGIYASNSYSGDVLDYPPVRLAAAVSGRERPMSIDFALVNNSPQAQRCAKILGQREAAGKGVQCTTSLYGFNAVPGETIEITRSSFGLSAADKRVIDTQLVITQQGEDKVGLSVELALEAGDASLYAWDAEETATPDAPGLPNPQVPPRVGEVRITDANVHNSRIEATVTSGVRFNSNGQLEFARPDGTWTAQRPFQWLGSGGRDYWVRFTVNSGTLTSGTEDTWLPTTSSEAFTIQQASEGTKNANVTAELAADSAGAEILDSAVFDLEAEYTVPSLVNLTDHLAESIDSGSFGDSRCRVVITYPNPATAGNGGLNISQGTQTATGVAGEWWNEESTPPLNLHRVRYTVLSGVALTDEPVDGEGVWITISGSLTWRNTRPSAAGAGTTETVVFFEIDDGAGNVLDSCTITMHAIKTS